MADIDITPVKIMELSREAELQFIEIMESATIGGGAAEGMGRGSSGGGRGKGRSKKKKDIDDDILKSKKSEITAVKRVSGVLGKFGQVISGVRRIIESELARDLVGEFKSSVRTGAEAVQSIGEYTERQKQAYLQLGVSLEATDAFSKTARAAQHHLGGYNELLDKAKGVQFEYFSMIGDHTKALEHQGKMLDLVTHSGLTVHDFFGPFGKEMRTSASHLKKLGISVEETMAFREEMMEL